MAATSKRRFVSAVLAVGTSGMFAIAAATQTPSAVVLQVFAAMDSSHWSQVVVLTHPEALKRFHEEEVRMARQEDDLRANASLPIELREHKPIYTLLYGVASAEQLDAMPTKVMLGHYLDKQGSAFRLGAAEPSRHLPMPLILGTVTRGDSVAYVVFIWTTSTRGEPDSLLAASRDGQSAVTTLKMSSCQEVWKCAVRRRVMLG